MIQKSYSLGLVAVFLFLSACGGGGGSEGQTSTVNTTADTPSSTNSSESTSTTGTDTVAPAGTLRVQWVAPVSRSDGGALSLSEIAGYTIYFGSSKGDYPYSAAVEDSTATSLEIPNLPVGTYYLVMTTTDTQGLESGYSTVAVKKITS